MNVSFRGIWLASVVFMAILQVAGIVDFPWHVVAIVSTVSFAIGSGEKSDKKSDKK